MLYYKIKIAFQKTDESNLMSLIPDVYSMPVQQF